MNRKEEISKGCGIEYIGAIPKGTNELRIGKAKCDGIGELPLCPTCQARLDERIRAEQDFLKMIDNSKIATANGTLIIKKLLKSTIKQEKTNG